MRNRKIALCDAHMVVNDCRVFLGHPDPIKAEKTAQDFKKQIGKTIARAKSPNLHDMYDVHFRMCENLALGKGLLSE